MGTKFAVEHFLKAYNWDNMTRLATLPSQPGKINVHEFDYKGANKNVYEKNGVTIKSWPAIHMNSLQGPRLKELRLKSACSSFPTKACRSLRTAD